MLAILGILLVCLPRWMGSQEAAQSPPSSALPAASSSSSIALTSPISSPAISDSAISDSAIETITYEAHQLPHSVVHVLHIPPQPSLQVTPALASGVDTLADFAAVDGTIATVNGGFFDPVNQQTTSYIVLNGAIAANPAENQRLVSNPEMMPYLDRILNRSEFRQYQCGQTRRYDIAAHSDPIPDNCQLLNALGGGPQLLPELALVEEGFVEIVEGERVRDALGSAQPNARTAVGITASGDIVLVMAAQLPEWPAASGLSLPELAEFMQTIGVTAAMNLDGGSSAAFFYQGQTHYGKVDADGNRVERPVKSALLVENFAA